ncbi:hypothetical protein BDQ12DRAFT_728082 [Crucibulum laeve]|uniref:Uncharacterized protein n=1 Tax=Crucibulum laeve TaxID=68775 RepID=A0A5C3LJR0_9AGAR|nr:hypothetical protein BDQ12DRAFT_728082 [Crucibulum laeve]
MPWLSKVRVFAIRKTKIAGQPSSARDDWLSNAITFGKALQVAGELAPFPYIKGAAGILVALLEPIQQLYRNRDDYKCLTESIVTILKNLEQDVHQNTASMLASEQFKEQCKEVEAFLHTISDNLQVTFDPSNMNRFKEMWSSNSHRDLIAQYRLEVDQLRQNLILRNTTYTRMYIEENYQALAQLTERDNDPSIAVAEDNLRLSDYQQYLPGDLQLLAGRCSLDPAIETCSVTLPDISERKTAQLYRGKDAYKRWKEDFRLLSQFYHPHIQQIFGVIPSKNHPVLIFHEGKF